MKTIHLLCVAVFALLIAGCATKPQPAADPFDAALADAARSLFNLTH